MSDMTREEAIGLLSDYCDYVRHAVDAKMTPEFRKDVGDLLTRLPPDAPDTKVHRWLGWMQGMLEGANVFTRAQLRAHSKAKSLAEGQAQVKALQALNLKRKNASEVLKSAENYRLGGETIDSLRRELDSIEAQIRECHSPTRTKAQEF